MIYVLVSCGSVVYVTDDKQAATERAEQFAAAQFGEWRAQEWGGAKMSRINYFSRNAKLGSESDLSLFSQEMNSDSYFLAMMSDAINAKRDDDKLRRAGLIPTEEG